MSTPPQGDREKQDSAHELRQSGSHGGVVARRRALSATALVLVMALIAGLPSLWTRDLWHDDEIRLTEGARELLQSSHGLLPQVNGEPELTAPQLPYWATALLWKTGAGVLSARVLSILSVLGMLMVCFVAMLRPGGIARAIAAPGIALTTMIMFWHVRKGGPATFGALLLTCAMLAGYQAIESTGKRRGAWWVACYAGAALAVLAIGLSAAPLVALVLGAYSFASRRQPNRSVVPHLLGLVVFAAVIATCPAVIYHAVPGRWGTLAPLTQDFAGLWESVREENLLKALLETAAGLLPWIVLLPGALSLATAKDRLRGESFGLFTAVWLGVLAVPAILGGREGAPNYAIAIVPPLAMLCAGALAPGARRSGQTIAALRWPLRVALAIVGAFTGLVLVIGLLHMAGLSYWLVGKRHVCPVTDQPYSPYTLAAILPFLAASFASVVVAFRTSVGRPDRRAWLLIIAVFLVGIPADLFLTPFVNAFRSARPFAEKVVQHVRPEDSLYLYRKEYDGLYNLYAGRARIPVLEGEKQLLEHLARPGVLIIADEKYIKRIDAPVDLTDLLVAGGHVGSRYMLLLRGGTAAGAEGIPPSGHLPVGPLR